MLQKLKDKGTLTHEQICRHLQTISLLKPTIWAQCTTILWSVLVFCCSVGLFCVSVGLFCVSVGLLYVSKVTKWLGRSLTWKFWWYYSCFPFVFFLQDSTWVVVALVWDLMWSFTVSFPLSGCHPHQPFKKCMMSHSEHTSFQTHISLFHHYPSL